MSEIVPFLNGARNCIKFGNVKAGEQVMLLVEPGYDPVTIEAISIAANEVGAKVFVLIKEQLNQGDVVPELIAQAAKGADIIYDMGHPIVQSRAAYTAIFDYGTKWIATRPERRALSSPGALFPVELFYRIGKKCQKLIRDNPVIHITDKKGTDLTIQPVPGGVGGYIGPVPGEPGPAVPGYLGTFPPGTTVWCDLNNSSKGVVYLDGIHSRTRLKTPVKFTVDGGFVTRIEGGAEADEINSMIHGIRNANRLSEFGFGMNPHITVNLDAPTEGGRVINLVMCSRRAGTFFIGLGPDALQGGKYSGQFMPLMAMLYEPRVTAGNITLIENGKLLPLADSDIWDAARQYGNPEELLRYLPLNE